MLFCLLNLRLVPLRPGPSPDGSDGRSASDGSSADDVQPACSQTHQPLHTHARSTGILQAWPRAVSVICTSYDELVKV